MMIQTTTLCPGQLKGWRHLSGCANEDHYVTGGHAGGRHPFVECNDISVINSL